MPTIEEKLVLAREARVAADEQFRETLREARTVGISWSKLSAITGMSEHGIRYLTLNLNERRQAQREEARREREKNERKAKRKKPR